MKKRALVHEGIIRCLREEHLRDDQVHQVICLYAFEDSFCPAEAIPRVIDALEFRRTISIGINKNIINRAIVNLQAQLTEHAAGEALVSKDKAKDEARIKEEENFQNPSLDQPWNHKGKFTVELRTLGCQRKADVIMQHMKETDGFVASHETLVVTAAGERRDEWQWQDIEVIRDGEGKLLWKRKRNRKFVKLPSPFKPKAADLSRSLGLDRSSNHP